MTTGKQKTVATLVDRVRFKSVLRTIVGNLSERTICPVKEPMTALLLHAERLMDGWGWIRISNGRRQNALDRRTHNEVLSEVGWFAPLKGSRT
jgi:hypothetical protein